ncbi:hypothetical protein PC112_g954 [Phytophthora cactorum]|nr:hypothetical protein PC112_g954 [Phytophthora cactorum]
MILKRSIACYWTPPSSNHASGFNSTSAPTTMNFYMSVLDASNSDGRLRVLYDRFDVFLRQDPCIVWSRINLVS